LGFDGSGTVVFDECMEAADEETEDSFEKVIEAALKIGAA
jgi:hypothetical protein